LLEIDVSDYSAERIIGALDAIRAKDRSAPIVLRWPSQVESLLAAQARRDAASQEALRGERLSGAAHVHRT
jgi:hypothetical protein